MIQSIVVAARDRERLAEVFAIATRFGLDGLLSRLGIRKGNVEDGPEELPARVRRALEELGPTYIKLGQILATRRDFLTDSWTEAFEHLQSGASTLPFGDLRQQVEDSLGEPVETAFASFDPVPLAAASIAQVHRARLPDGTDVVVKIRRPGVRRRMEADLRLIRQLAAIMESNSAEARRFGPVAMADQLARDILDELDFTNEGRNADVLRADLQGNDRVLIPAIHWQWTAEDLLVMDFISGVPPRDPAALRGAGIDPTHIAAIGADLVLDMVLINGRFHGDPHPGNLLCLPGNRLALLDLGSVGTVSTRRQHEFLTFMLGLKAGDAAAVADMLTLWSRRAPVPHPTVLNAAERLVARHSGGPIVLGAVVDDFFLLLRHERLVMPPDLLLIFKALVTMDGVLERIAPGFDLAGPLEDLRAKLVASRIADLIQSDRAGATLLELSRLAAEAPHFLRTAAQWMERQPDEISSDPAGKGATIAGAVIVAAAILIHAIILKM